VAAAVAVNALLESRFSQATLLACAAAHADNAGARKCAS
jgi:hypothetical protein